LSFCSEFWLWLLALALVLLGCLRSVSSIDGMVD